MRKIEEALQGKIERIGISGHIRPDGDCIGAALGLYYYLKALRPELTVQVYLESVPQRFDCVPGIDLICREVKDEPEYDLFFAVDCGDEERLGPAMGYFEKAKRTVCIDHHISNVGFADENHIEPDAGSTCEILYSLMDLHYVTEDGAVCLYMGMAHDTGIFEYSSTTPRTLRSAADLMERAAGRDLDRLIRDTFREKTYSQMQIMGHALTESMLLFDGRCVVAAIKQKEMEFYGVDKDGMEGIVNQLLLIRGVEVAVFMYELESQVFRVSLRSKYKVDVNQVAVALGGGGHKRAAGCTVTGNFHDVVNSLTLHIQKRLEE